MANPSRIVGLKRAIVAKDEEIQKRGGERQ